MSAGMQHNERVTATLDRIRILMADPAPRHVPSDVWRLARSPVTLFLFIFMTAESLVFLMALIFLANNQGTKNNALALYVLGVCFACSIAVMAVSLFRHYLGRQALAKGSLYRGNVINVKPLPAHINGRTFFSVEVEFEGRDGERLRGKDIVDNWSVEYFLNARDSGNEVEMIYAPNTRRKVILPMKMAIGNRYD